jgi:hypothetical protein
VLWISLDTELQVEFILPVNDNDVSDAWEYTLDEYEKSILRGDTNGAGILRALLLEKLKGSQVTDCGFCGKSLTECECPQPV